MRLIDAEELLRRGLDYFVEEYQGTEEEFERTELKKLVDDSQTVDAAIALHDIFLHVGSITYGKERWFDQGDGTWYDRRHCDYVPLDEAAERLIETVREIEEDMEHDRWIPVTEMLPEDSPVLATNIFDFYIVGKIYPYENCQTGYCCESMLGGDLMTNVTAWMPLPTPYKEGEEHETD